jgi:hypothetical protein
MKRIYQKTQTLGDFICDIDELNDAYSVARDKKLAHIKRLAKDFVLSDVIIATYRIGNVRNTLLKIEKVTQ